MNEQNDQYKIFQQNQHQNSKKFQCQDFKSLYFESLRTIRQLTSIDNTLQNAANSLNSQQIKSIVNKYQKQIIKINKIFIQKDQQIVHLSNQLKKLQELNQQKEIFLKRKLQSQYRNKVNLVQEIQLLKEEIKILKKQKQNVQSLKIRFYEKISEGNIEDMQRRNQNRSNEQEQEKQIFKKLKEIINCQQNEIQQFKNRYLNLQNKFHQSKQIVLKLQLQILSQVDFHKIQLESKSKFIEQLAKELQSLKKQISKLSKNIQKEDKHEQIKAQNQKFSKSGKEIEVKLQIQIKQNQNLINCLKKYQSMLNQQQMRQNKLYEELNAKDLQKQQIQENQKQLKEEIIWLQSIINDLKGSYIHSQLQKQNYFEKYKQQQKSIQQYRYLNTRATQQIKFKLFVQYELYIKFFITLKYSKKSQQVYRTLGYISWGSRIFQK